VPDLGRLVACVGVGTFFIMANRILRDWTDSDKINELSPLAERFFTRLIMKADDFGRFYANTQLLKANLFPLQLQTKDSDLEKWLTECVNCGLIKLYFFKSKAYLQIENFNQRLRRMISKYPDPASADNAPPTDSSPLTIDGEVRSDDSSPPPETNPETKQKQNPETEGVNATPLYRSFRHLKLTINDFDKLRNEGWTKHQIDLTLDSIENYKKNTNYVNLLFTCRSWLNKDHKKQQNKHLESMLNKQSALEQVQAMYQKQIDNDTSNNDSQLLGSPEVR